MTAYILIAPLFLLLGIYAFSSNKRSQVLEDMVSSDDYESKQKLYSAYFIASSTVFCLILVTFAFMVYLVA